jgi:general stress protein 26
MDNDLGKRITEYMGKCSFCTVATVSRDGQPDAATVYINSSGTDIYFNTAKDSQKIQNISANPRIAIAMQTLPMPKTDQEITGIQFYGTARILSDEEIAQAPHAVAARHRTFNSLRPDNSVIVKATPLKIHLVDYSKGFRHRDALQF